jgi:hypothetical protein
LPGYHHSVPSEQQTATTRPHFDSTSLRAAVFEFKDKDDDEDSDSTELAEVLPDEACGL